MKSVMQHSFSQVPNVEIQRSSFDRSHGHKTTFNAGYLVPIYVDEALPGDTFNMNATCFARLATPIFPIMDNMYLDVHFFAVPLRQLWTNFRKFMGEQVDPGDSIDFIVPEANASPTEGSFEDYIGLPIGTNIPYSDLFSRAYKHIYNEWYRDQNLIDSVSFETGDDGETAPTSLLKRGKRHDYFTSCLPWPQKGDDVSLPLGTTADIYLYPGGGEPWEVVQPSTGGSLGDLTAVPTDYYLRPTNDQSGVAQLDPKGTLFADLTNATAATINDLRRAFQIQKLLERDARGGTRYAEIVKSHFGVNFFDITYRPEYLGGGSAPVNINPVASTTVEATSETSIGTLGAFGTVGASGMGFTKSFTEHCIVMGIASVRCDLTYQQGINRMFSRRTRYDFFWPALANIGEQEVYNKEIFVDGSGDDDAIFGYQERYAEYRYKPSIITGKMRSDATDSLDAWHLSQDFADHPVLGPTFINEDPPMDRVLAIPTQPHFIFDSYFSLRCARPMPLFGVPGNMDRF